MKRYERQIMIPQIGIEGQQRLSNANVAVIGAGGLGSPVLTYLVQAGVGHIRCVDCDRVSESNLNRQFLHTEENIGKEKTASAKESLERMNSQIEIQTADVRLTEENVDNLITGADVVVDCVDNIAARLIVNEACIRLNIPLVEGGINGFYGFVTAIDQGHACLECMGYHKGMDKECIPALGTTAGVIGALQANECIKIILGAGTPLYGRMLQYDGLYGSFDEIEVFKNEACQAHQKIKTNTTN